MHKKTVFFILLLLWSFYSTAQLSYEKRVEIDLSNEISDTRLIEFGKKGFILLSKIAEPVDGNSEWKIDFYGVDLLLVKSKSLILPRKFFLYEFFIDKENLYAFFKDSKGNYNLVKVNAENLSSKETKGSLPKKTYVKDMVVSGNCAYFSATIKNESFLYTVKLESGERKFIPIVVDSKLSGKKISLLSFQTLDESKEVLLYVNTTISKTKSNIYILKFNDRGEKESTFNLTQNLSQNIIDISGSKIGDNKYVFTGTYSTKSTNTSEGMFFCQLTNKTMDYIKFYNFMDFKNFLDYMPAKQKEKFEKKKSKKESQGKEFSIYYHLASHEIIPTEDGYLFLSEAYFPTYRTETHTTTTFVNGRATTQTHTRTVFDGYQYTHAVVAKFDNEGTMKWDQSFAMWPSYKPYTVKRFIAIAEQNKDNIKLLFSMGNVITYKSINFDGSESQNNRSSTIETNYSGDVTKYSYSNIDYWYDDYFICFGSQKIKNKTEKEVDRKRNIFFISKVKFQ